MLKIKNKLGIIVAVLILLLVTVATAAAASHQTITTVKPDVHLDMFPRIGVAPVMVTFIDIGWRARVPTTWRYWDFGDGTHSHSMLIQITHLYSKPGTYHVSATAGNAAGSSTDKGVVKVYGW